MAKTEKVNKFKSIGLTTLLSGGMLLGGVSACQGHKTSNVDSNHTKDVSIETEDVAVLEKYMEHLDEALAIWEQKLKSDNLNPEEEFEAKQACRNIKQKRTDLKKRLDRAKKQQKPTIRYHNIDNVR